MTKETATKVQWVGCITIVVAMLFSHFIITISDSIMLGIAIVSFILMATGMIRLKIIAAQEEKLQMEGKKMSLR